MLHVSINVCGFLVVTAMAFFGRFGNLLRHAAANRQIMHSSPSFFQAIRCKSSSTPTSRLYVGNIPYNTVYMDLQELFSRYGRVFGGKYSHFRICLSTVRNPKGLNELTSNPKVFTSGIITL